MVESQPKFFIPDSINGVNFDVAAQIKMVWEVIKAPLIVPLLNLEIGRASCRERV